MRSTDIGDDTADEDFALEPELVAAETHVSHVGVVLGVLGERGPKDKDETLRSTDIGDDTADEDFALEPELVAAEVTHTVADVDQCHEVEGCSLLTVDQSCDHRL